MVKIAEDYGVSTIIELDQVVPLKNMRLQCWKPGTLAQIMPKVYQQRQTHLISSRAGLISRHFAIMMHENHNIKSVDHTQQVEAYAVEEDGWLVITVIVKFF